MAEHTGHFVVQNFVVAENKRAGIEFYKANYTKENNLVENSVFIGVTISSGLSSSYAHGLVTPRTGSTNLTDVRFYNFPNGSSALATCSQCTYSKKMTNLGTELFLRGI